MNNTENKGTFIVIEGPDGSGKTTISEKLNNVLLRTGHDSIITRDPGGIKPAEMIREIVKNNKLTQQEYTLLFLASKSMNCKHFIVPALENGKIAICDRFFRSTYIYQGWYDTDDVKLFKDLIKYACYGIVPTVEFVLKVSPEVAWKRIQDRHSNIDVFKEKFEYTSMINRKYQDIERSKNVFTHPVYEINAEQSSYDVLNDIINILIKDFKFDMYYPGYPIA